ncbi:MAG: hypothetical protein ABF489_05155 [Bifidobacterium sp.]|uniref:hypothetical protein n=1 Tax=Bifidobacterium sp. TaxID=41200 RepID=UPI0039EC2061
MLGISGSEFLVLLILVAAVIGPDSVVKALKGFKSGVESLRHWSAKLREETKGDMPHAEMPEVNLPTFNLDDYDPREIIRRAVREEMTEWVDEVAKSNAQSKNVVVDPAQSAEEASQGSSPAESQGPSNDGNQGAQRDPVNQA